MMILQNQVGPLKFSINRFRSAQGLRERGSHARQPGRPVA